jgi:hypothetical protein
MSIHVFLPGPTPAGGGGRARSCGTRSCDVTELSASTLADAISETGSAGTLALDFFVVSANLSNGNPVKEHQTDTE